MHVGASAKLCGHCNKSRGSHRTTDAACPVGMRHRTVGYTTFNPEQSFIERTGPLKPVELKPGERFGLLTVKERYYGEAIVGGARYVVVCDCGKEKLVRGNNLRDQRVMTCGGRKCMDAFFGTVKERYDRRKEKKA